MYGENMKSRAKTMLNSDDVLDVTSRIEEMKDVLDGRKDRASISDIHSLWAMHTVM